MARELAALKITDALTLKEFSGSMPVSLGAQQSTRVQSAADAIRARWPDIVPEVSEKDGNERLRRVAICERNNNWEGTKRSDILIAARVAFSNQWIEESRLTHFRTFLIEELAVTEWAGLRRVMFDIYIASYAPNVDHTYGLAQAIGLCGSRLGLNEQKVLEAVPELLDPSDAPNRIAKRLIKEPSPLETLHRWGLKENYDDGLMCQVHLSLVRQFKPRLTKEDPQVLERFLAWLRPAGMAARQLGAGLAIDAVLEPWHNQTPSPDYQASLVSGLVATYGDPRLQKSAAWQEASSNSVGLMRRWLTGETMLVFLKAISRTNDEDMWKPRRKFWMELYELKKIDEAWVAFSDEAYHAAQRMATSEHEKSLYRSFGRQVARGSRTSTSLLIMRIGTRVIVEGSHSYKVQLFERDNSKTPRLYQKSYDCEVIRHSSNEQKMHSVGSWQPWVRQKVL